MEENATETNFWKAFHFTIESIGHIRSVFNKSLKQLEFHGGKFGDIKLSLTKLSKYNSFLKLSNRQAGKFLENLIDIWDHEIFCKAFQGLYVALVNNMLEKSVGNVCDFNQELKSIIEQGNNYCDGIRLLYKDCRCEIAHRPPSLSSEEYEKIKGNFMKAMKLLGVAPPMIPYLILKSEMEATPNYNHLGQMAFQEGNFKGAVQCFKTEISLVKNADKNRASIIQVLNELISVCFLEMSKLEEDDVIRKEYCVEATKYRQIAAEIRDKNNPILPTPIFYINRNISRRKLLPKSIFSVQTGEIFAFTGDNLHIETLKELAKPSTPNIMVYDNQDIGDFCFIILHHAENWQDLCNRIDSNRTIHLICLENENFFWICSRGDIRNIHNEFERYNQLFEQTSETNFIKQLQKMEAFQTNNNTICIGDTPGMGKTFLLQNCGHILQETFPDRMVMFASLPVIVNAVKALPTSSVEPIDFKVSLKNNLTDFIINRLYKEEEGQFYLKEKINSDKNVIGFELLLDGFDEVIEDDFDLAFECLQILKTHYSNCIRVWISTRPHLLNKLENALGTIGFGIQPFSQTDQETFLMTSWTQNTENIDMVKLKLFASECLSQINDKLNKSGEDLVGIPMQCYLIAECFESDAHRQCVQSDADIENNGNQTEVNFNINSITSMYEKLIEKKYLKKMRVVDQNLANLYSKQIRNVTFQHAHLALKILFPSAVEIQEKCASFIKPQLNDDELLKVGLLQASSTEEVPKFIHLTIAEYLVAWFLVKFMKQAVRENDTNLKDFFLNSILVSSECSAAKPWDKQITPIKKGPSTRQFKHLTICYFLNCILRENKNERNIFFEYCHVHPVFSNIIQASVYSDFYYIAKLKFTHDDEVQTREAKTDAEIEQYTNRLRNLLFTAIAFSSPELFKFAFGQFCCDEIQMFYDKEVVCTYMNAFNGYEKLTVLQLALIRGNYEIFRFIIVILFWNFYSDFQQSKSHSLMNLLHFCVRDTRNEKMSQINERIEIMRDVISLKPETLEYVYATVTPLLEKKMHPKLLIELVNLGADPKKTDMLDYNILQLAPTSFKPDDYHEICEFLANKLEADDFREIVQMKGSADESVLQQIAYAMCPKEETVSLLLEYGADINEVDASGITVLDYSIMSHQLQHLNPAKIWVNLGATVTSKQVHTAVTSENLHCLQYFIEELHFNINIEDETGATPLEVVLSDLVYGHSHNSQRILEDYKAGRLSSKREIKIHEMFQFMKNHGAKFRNVEKEQSIIMDACKNQNDFVLKILFEDLQLSCETPLPLG